jgi:hypothetical protein
MNKTISLMAPLVLGAALLLVNGCSRSESEPPKPEQPEAGAAQTLGADAIKRATATAETVRDTAKEATDQASNRAQELITQARGLVDAKKYAEASNILQQLASLKLTPEQHKLVDDLKSRIQQGLAQQATSQAGDVVGNVLGGKK